MANHPVKYVHFTLSLDLSIILLQPLDLKLQQHLTLGKWKGNTGSPEILQLVHPKVTSDILIFATLLLILAILIYLGHL